MTDARAPIVDVARADRLVCGGVGALLTRCGPEKNTIQFAADGLNFEVRATIIDPPQAAGGLRIAEAENAAPLAGLRWGLSHVTQWSPHATRQRQDTLGITSIEEPWDFLIRWERHDQSLGWV